ncbi:MAG: bifunctional 4-hydroxy-2-oxoglutarate aldolase/2-dehydro-3-deoxy-phosphogluconate aldolase [Bacteroidota bacterium]
MARFTKIQVVQSLLDTGMLPLFYHPDIEVTKEVLKACYAGGVKLFEFTNRGDFAHEVFGEVVKWAAQETPDLMLGVGSVVDAPTTALYIQLGANFILSPILNPEMATVCNRRKIMWSPGCGTVSEISEAESLGAEIVKVFPGSTLGGPSFIKAVKGPQPWSMMMPTGGVAPTEENLKAWFEAGAACVGMGSKLFPKDVIAKGDWEWITRTCKEALAIINKVRSYQ